jgi:hypothetical protein
VEISSSISQENPIQERQSIIAQAKARGLQLSEDGMSWVPINPKSSNLSLSQSNMKIVKELPSELSLDDNNVMILKNENLDNSQAAVIIIFYLFITVIIVIPSFWLVSNIVYFLFWCLTFQWWNGDSFTPLSFFEIFSILG